MCLPSLSLLARRRSRRMSSDAIGCRRVDAVSSVLVRSAGSPCPVLASIAAARLSRLAVSLVSIVRPACSCRGAGSSGVVGDLPAVFVSFPARCVHRLLREGGDDAMSVWIV